MASLSLHLCSKLKLGVARRAASFKNGTGIDVNFNLIASGGKSLVNISHVRNGGFTINGQVVKGSVAMFNGMFLRWNVNSLEEVTEESLSLFKLMNPPLDILVLGTGDSVQRLDPKIVHFLKTAGILVEIQSTVKACATYNFLLEEGRITAALLLAPKEI